MTPAETVTLIICVFIVIAGVFVAVWLGMQPPPLGYGWVMPTLASPWVGKV